MRTLLLAATGVAVCALGMCAHAKDTPATYLACVYEMVHENGFPDLDARRMCNPENQTNPDEVGWGCMMVKGKFKFYRVTGGAKHKRDAVCE